MVPPTSMHMIAAAVAEATAQDLTVRLTESEIAYLAWKKYPRRFSLKGHLDHADSKKVSIAIIRRPYGALDRGLLRRAGKGYYSLTQEGLVAAKECA